MTENTRAALLMTLSMALFAVEDAFVKHLTVSVPVWQVLAFSGSLGLLIFWLRLAQRGQRMWSPALLHPMVLLRNLGEGVGAMAYVIALAVGSLAAASAILQAAPLMIVLGAALFLGEKVGWRRWLSVAAGLVGVLMILRPGTGDFQPAALWAVLSVLALALRDLATRRIPAAVPSDQLSGSAFGAMVLAGLALAPFAGDTSSLPSAGNVALLVCAVGFGVTGYSALVAASRLGEASVVAPFRYTRLAFALFLAALIFGERPDAMTLAGAALIAVAGAYAMWREAQLGRRATRPPADSVVRPGE